MIPGPALGTAAAARDTLDNDLVRHLQQHHRYQFGAATPRHAVQNLGLRHRARKTVQQHCAFARHAADIITDHLAYDDIRHQFAALHVALGRHPCRSLPLDRVTQQVAARHMAQRRVRRRQTPGDRSLAGTRRPKKNHYFHDASQFSKHPRRHATYLSLPTLPSSLFPIPSSCRTLKYFSVPYGKSDGT